MECSFCGNKIRTLRYGLVCKKCETGSFLARASSNGLMQWHQSLATGFDNLTWRNMKIRVAHLIQEIQERSPQKSLLEQADELDHLILQDMKQVISFYHKDDLVVATLVIKEACRVSMLNPKEIEDEWSVQNEYAVAILLQQEIMKIEQTDFVGAPIETLDRGYYGFITAIVCARVLVMLRDNHEKYKILRHTDSLMELAFKFHEDEAMEKFYERYMNDGSSEKPEDLAFEDKDLENELVNRGLTFKQIKDEIIGEVKSRFGITFEDLSSVFNTKELFIGKAENILPLKIMKKDKLIMQGVDSTVVEKSIALLSINQLLTKIDAPTLGHFELRSIYEVDEFIVFGEIDLIQNIATFEKLIVSGHFINMYDESASLTAAFMKAQNKMSSLFAHKLAESLKKNQYIVPTEIKRGKEIVRAEIVHIPDDNKKNILKRKDGINLGDIDALAINPKTNQVLIYELKFFKPATSFREMVYSDKRKIVNDDIVRKILNRQEAVEENLKSVVAFIGGDPVEEYSVKSVLVTIRTNYYCYYEDIGVEFVTWNELHEELIKHLQDYTSK